MPEFLELLTPDEGISRLQQHIEFVEFRSENIRTEKGLNRVIARNINSDEDIPAFTRSTVDGFAVKSKDTFGASDVLPAFFEVAGEIQMGKPANLQINKGQACLIHTGGMLPVGADAVVMVENTQYSNSKEIEVYKAVPAGENVILKGEDVTIGDVVVRKGTKVRASEIGALMALGITEIEVYDLPKVGILSTGDEIIPPHKKPDLGQIRDINSYSLGVIVEKFGGIPKCYPIIQDDKSKLLNSLRQAHDENDLVIVTAGSSASVRDLTADAINELGTPGVLVHGINVRPGKPTILAFANGKPIIGLPGNPVSAFVIAHLLLRRIMPKMRGELRTIETQTMKGKVTINISSAAGREDWMPVRLLEEENNGLKLVEPIFYKSNLIFSLIDAIGLARIAPEVTGLEANSEVEILLI
ncbi:MAG: molybdopterin molybdotransferase MoeA [Anaerolineaceae bacterium]|nr:molybdopterin molybdotransferase MoeA [Anaerolineaceae bacterium]